MTLILTAVNKNFVSVASDTRLTGTGGTLVDDNAVKCIKLDCSNGSFLIAYTGLAKYKGVKTDHWLVDVLTSFKAGTKPVEQVVTHLKDTLETYFASLNLSAKQKMTTVVVAGWRRKETETSAVVISVSNCENEQMETLQSARDEFIINILTIKANAKDPCAVLLNGTEPAVSEKYFDGRIKLLIKRLRRASSFNDMQSIRSQSVSLIRIGASHKQWGKYIGKNCITAIMPKSTGAAECEYFPEKDKGQLFAPHLVTSFMAVSDITVGGRDITDGGFRLGATK